MLTNFSETLADMVRETTKVCDVHVVHWPMFVTLALDSCVQAACAERSSCQKTSERSFAGVQFLLSARGGGKKKWFVVCLRSGEESSILYVGLLLLIVVMGVVPECILACSSSGQTARTNGKSDSLVFVVSRDILPILCEFLEILLIAFVSTLLEIRGCHCLTTFLLYRVSHPFLQCKVRDKHSFASFTMLEH